jgi:hypothetical protein
VKEYHWAGYLYNGIYRVIGDGLNVIKGSNHETPLKIFPFFLC